MVRRLHFLSIALGACLVLMLGCSDRESAQPTYRADLRPYGEKVEVDWRNASYSQASFLSDRLLLVVINQRVFIHSVELSQTEEPPATLLLFDVKNNVLLNSREMPIEKESHSVQAISQLRFVIWDQSGFHICDIAFSCSQPIPVPGRGPILASPAGVSFVVGGYSKTQQSLISSVSLNELGRYASENPAVVPGDGAILLSYNLGNELRVKKDGEPEKVLPIGEGSGNLDFLLTSRFLNDSVLGISESLESLLVAKIDGTPLYRTKVSPWYRGTYLFTSSSGKRFGVYEKNWTRLNSLTHFYDVENERNYDYEKLRVIDIESGRSLFELVSDPRPYFNRLPPPCLSPDGHSLAIIRHGYLEVYSVP